MIKIDLMVKKTNERREEQMQMMGHNAFFAYASV